MFTLSSKDGDRMRQLLVVVTVLALGVEKNPLNNLRNPSDTTASYNMFLCSRLGICRGIFDTALRPTDLAAAASILLCVVYRLLEC